MADDAGAAGAVDHVERLAEVLLQQRRHDAGGCIRAAAGAPGHDHGHRPRRIGLRRGRLQPKTRDGLRRLRMKPRMRGA
jgi:hypothetical protein